MRRSHLLVGFAVRFALCAAPIAAAHAQESVSESASASEGGEGNGGGGRELFRYRYPTTVFVAGGDPAPSFLGVGAGYQFDPAFQILGAFGGSWFNDLTVRSLGATTRFHLVNANLAPFFGAGVTWFYLTGTGQLQGLEGSTVLGSLQVGFDWCFASGLRVTGGYAFHYPVKLNFPLANVGWTF